MIDFRYHLVSLVSVFLALAVGIVLGAGPLKESLGDSLNRQVQALREDRESLRGDLGRVEISLEHRDEFLTAVTPKLVADSLAGRKVAVVSVPGADKDTVEATEATLRSAGATLTGRIELTDGWTDADRTDDRLALARSLAPSLLPAESASSADLAQVLGASVLAAEPTGTLTMPPQAAAALSRLREDRFVRGDRLPTARASVAVVVAPPVATDLSGTDLDRRKADATAWRGVAVALDAAGEGAVVEGPASAAGPGGVVEAVRAGDARRSVSTVDTGTTPMGPVTAALALAEQIRGQVGHYGFGDGAAAVLPAGGAS
ncbi:MAG: copper transporter [Kineosporiaceae bacterium]